VTDRDMPRENEVVPNDESTDWAAPNAKNESNQETRGEIITHQNEANQETRRETISDESPRLRFS
jgi:hypothetical protein